MHGFNNLFLFLNRILGNGHGVKVSRLQIWRVPVYWSSILFVWVHVQYQLIDTYWKKNCVFATKSINYHVQGCNIVTGAWTSQKKWLFWKFFGNWNISVLLAFIMHVFIKDAIFFYYLFKYFPRFGLFGRKKINWNLLYVPRLF